MRTALTIAGSDSGGGAGIQADLKTFAAHGVFGTSAITAVTAQNTLGVVAWQALSADLVTAQIEAIAGDIGADAVKIGMLATAAIVEAVAAAIEAMNLPHVVVDPVMIAKGGDRLLEADAVAAMRAELLPRARIVTPNVPEAEVLAGMPMRSLDDMREAGRRILGSRAARRTRQGRPSRGPRRDRRRVHGGRDLRDPAPADRHPAHPRDRMHAVVGDRGEPGARADGPRRPRARAGLSRRGDPPRAGPRRRPRPAQPLLARGILNG